MIKTVEVLKNYWLPISLICHITGISNTSLKLIYGWVKELSPSMKKTMEEKMIKFLTDLSVSLDD